MEPAVLDVTEKNNLLTFTISNINVSYANALRRVILSDIETVVFRTFPHDKSDATFYINTSRLNNEILKQRLSSIPIHITDFEINLKDYVMELDIKNDTESIIYITSADFKILNLQTEKYLPPNILKDIFPPDPISNQYIDFCRLRPRISDNIPGEHLKLSCTFSKGKASESGTFNVVSTCSYSNTVDPILVDETKALKLEELREKYPENESEITDQLNDWLNLDAKRLTVPDSYDFKIESLGVFENQTIVQKGIHNIMDRLAKIINIYSKPNDLILNSDATIPNSFDIVLEDEDYTIGKILEYTLYHLYYLGNGSLTYCGFRKPHPHIKISIIRIAFRTTTEKNTVIEHLVNAAQFAIQYYKKLLPQFGEILSEALEIVETVMPTIITVKSKSPPTEPGTKSTTKSDAKSDTKSDTKSDAETDANVSTDAETDANVSSDAETDADVSTDAETDVDVSTDAETDVEATVPLDIPGTAEEIKIEKIQ
jgi:DNA-directed RNA polymerase subunit L